MGCPICEQRFQGHDFNSVNIKGARMAFRGKVTGVYPVSQVPYMRPFSRYSTVTIQPRKAARSTASLKANRIWPDGRSRSAGG